jgi:hypothetical protein
MRVPQRDSATGGLFQAATDAARRLKREHRAEYERNPGWSTQPVTIYG